MLRYLLFILCFWQFANLSATNMTVGYVNNGSNDIATLWITKNPGTSQETTTPINLGATGTDSKALSLAQYLNQLYIVGYQENSGKKHAALWTCRLDGANVTPCSIDNTSNNSSANCIIWSGTCFYTAGYVEQSGAPHMNIWQIDVKNQNSISLIAQESNFVSNAFSIGLDDNQNIIISGDVIFAYSPNKYAAWCSFDPDSGSPGDINWHPLSDQSVSATGQSLALDLQNSIIYIAGSITQSSTKLAYIWKGSLDKGNLLDSQALSMVDAEALDLTLVNNQLYVAGYINNSGKKNACIWTAPKDALSSFLTLSTSAFLYPQNTPYTNCISSLNFIKGTLGSKKLPGFPLYAGGYFTFDLVPDAFYEKFSTTQNITNFGFNNLSNPPIVDLCNSTTANNKEAFDMLIDVRSPANTVKTVLSKKKTD